MDKSKTTTYIGIFVVGYVVFFIANFIYLKATVKWPEPEVIEDSLEVDEEPLDELNLTWDISGKSGPPRDRAKDIKKEQAKRTLAVVDSVVTKETIPLKETIKEQKQEIVQQEQKIDDLEAFLAKISSTSDSIDQAKAKRLTRMLQAMKPGNAAKIMIRLNNQANAELLLKMPQKKAAKIMAALPNERAAEIARYLSKAYARSSI